MMREVEQERTPNPLLKRQRELRGWSQGRVAQELQTLFPGIAVTGKEVGRWERGQRRTSYYYQEMLCAVFQTSADKLGFVQYDASFEQTSKEDETVQKEKHPVMDWGEAPASIPLYGRDSELSTLCSWVGQPACRVLALVGMGGIGKTSLAVECTQKVSHTFDALIFRSLVNAPPARQVIQDAIDGFSSHRHTTFPDDMQDLITLLIHTLQERRCVLVLDNYETILQAGKQTGVYREGYEDYGRLLKRIGETEHQSCLLLTSREKPPEVAMFEGEGAFTQSYPLAGLTPQFAQMILRDKGLHGEKKDQESLILRYGGNPLALKLVSQLIREVFSGEISAFLQDGDVIFHDIEDILDQQVSRLSPLELSLMYWLCIEREGTTLHHLHENLVHPVKKRALLEAVQSLQRRHLIEISPSGMTLQNVVMEYMTERLIAEVCSELQAGSLALCKSYALMQAQAKEYIRESQVHLIVQPIVKHLIATFGRVASETILKGILTQLRSADPQEPSYAAGNILNLLIQLGCDLRESDFSHLEIRQAYLQGVALREVNFTFSRLLNCVFTETFGSILSVAFSTDGKYLAAGTTNNEIRLWHIDGSPFLTLRGHLGWVRSITFNSGSRILVSGSDDQTVRLWDVNSGLSLFTLREHTAWVRSVSISSDGKFIASGGEDQRICLWDALNGKHLKTLQDHGKRIRSVVFSPDGRLLASSGDTQMISLWSVESGACLGTLQGHEGCVRSIVFSPDGCLLASAGDDCTVRLWNVEKKSCLKTLQYHSASIRSVVFHPDGKMLASGSEDKTVCLWDLESGHCFKTLQGHTNWVWSMAFSIDGKMLASGSEDKAVRLWNLESGHCIRTLLGYMNFAWSIAFRSDGKMLASGNEDQTVQLWETESEHCLRTLRGHSSRVRSIAFHPKDHNRIASSSEDGTIRIWDTNNGRQIQSLQGCHRIWSLAFSPDGYQLVGAGEDQALYLWERSDYSHQRKLLGHTDRIRAVTFSFTGKSIASAGEDQTVRLWEAKTGLCLHVLSGHTGRVWGVTFSPSDTFLASGGDDFNVCVWSMKSNHCLHTLRGHTARVRSIAFSPDEHILASGSEDATIRLWEVKTGNCLATLQGHTGRIRSLVFHPQEDILASSSEDGTIKLWDIRTKICLKTLKAHVPYENMNITGVQGLAEYQKLSLRILGAIEESISL